MAVRSAGAGSKGNAATPGPGSPPPPRPLPAGPPAPHTGELAFHYCYVPAGQPVTLARLIRAAGLRWPVEESFEFGKDLFGLDESQVRLYTAILRHTVLVMAALAVCAVTAARPPTAPTPRPRHRPRPTSTAPTPA